MHMFAIDFNYPIYFYSFLNVEFKFYILRPKLTSVFHHY